MGSLCWQAYDKNTQRQDQEYPGRIPRSFRYHYAEKLLKYNLIAAATYQIKKSGFFEERCSMVPCRAGGLISFVPYGNVSGSMSPAQPEPAGLKREIGLFGATALGIGAIIGSGILVGHRDCCRYSRACDDYFRPDCRDHLTFHRI